MKKLIMIVFALALLMVPQVSQAALLNFTDPTVEDSGYINGAYFEWIDASSTGSGVIDSFVRIYTDNIDFDKKTGISLDGDGKDGDSEGYNTRVDGVFNNGSDDTHNHELPLSLVPTVNIGGIDYKEFLLDINQTGSSEITLDEIQVFVTGLFYTNSNVNTFTGEIVDLQGDLVYQMDAGDENNTILLDYALNHGGGSGDMLFYVPISAFAGKSGDYVYLYSRFGGDDVSGYFDLTSPLFYNSNDGFEEWSVREGGIPPPVPEPASMLLLGSGLLGFAGLRRKRS